MRTTDTTEPSLTLADLHRLRRWYQTYAAERGDNLTLDDIILDNKFRALRYDMQDRIAARNAAKPRTAKPLAGERRSRVATPIARRVAPILKVELTH